MLMMSGMENMTAIKEQWQEAHRAAEEAKQIWVDAERRYKELAEAARLQWLLWRESEQRAKHGNHTNT